MKGKRWLILTQYYPPEIGAPQIRLHSLARELVRHGIEIEVLTALPNYPKGRIFDGYADRWRVLEELDGIRVRRTWVYPGTGKAAHVRLANYLSFTTAAFLEAICARKPDVLFVESQPLSLGIIALLLKWVWGVPYVYNVPDLQIDVAEQMGFIRNRSFLHLATSLENFFLRQAWTVSTVTDRFIAHFESRGIARSKISFLPNGADAEFLKPQVPCQMLLDRWNLQGKKVFVYVGTHAYYHGLDTLIEAAGLLRHNEEVSFLLVGDGPERSRVKSLASECSLSNVIFAESPYEEMPLLYSIAWASIATLRNIAVADSMRLSKVFPSLSCGVPVVYAGRGEGAELLNKYGCGIVVSPEDPVSLAEAIIFLARDPAKRSEMAGAGRRLVERTYSWSKIVERWLNEIENRHDRVPCKYPVPE